MGQNTTATIMMVRPVKFRLNEQTAVNNYYQKALKGITSAEVEAKAMAEFDDFVEKLRSHGVEVVVIQDTAEPSTPDSVFPNNWISFHSDGTIGLYPMYAENRRLERREDIMTTLVSQGFIINNRIDLTSAEDNNKFLEGTGSLIFDRKNRMAYAAISERTNPEVVKQFDAAFDFETVLFTSNQTVGDKRLPIYHTNVMMCIGDRFAVICLDTIDDQAERKMVVDSLEKSGKEIIEITEAQKGCFAGNMLQIENRNGEKFMVMSAAAHSVLTPDQIKDILKYNKDIISSSLDTIEALGGGSARCMMAEVFLPKN